MGKRVKEVSWKSGYQFFCVHMTLMGPVPFESPYSELSFGTLEMFEKCWGNFLNTFESDAK